MKILSFIFAFTFFLMVTAFETGAEQTYIVKKGDTLYKISRKFKIEVERIQEANKLDSIKLKPGTHLTIPSKGPNEKKHRGKTADESIKSRENPNGDSAFSTTITAESTPPTHETQYHTIKKGETLASISRKYSLSVKDLTELNTIKKSSKLKPGQQLIVKKAGPRTYTVRKGDTIRRIARKFDISVEELMEINELESDELKPGQKLLLEVWIEQPEVKNYPMLSQAKISEDINSMTESSELNSLSMKDRVMLFAKKMLDIPYRFGGSTFMGIDCSGYVQKVFGFLDVSLPRTAREQFHIGEPVSKEDLSIGDLVFFRTYASFPSHVGIYLGNNLFIHASSKSRKVSIDSLDTPYYFKRFIGAKRLFNDELDEKIEHGEKG